MDKEKKEGRYQRLYTQIEQLLQKSPDQTAAMATIAAVLYHKMEYFFWCGFYRVDGQRLIVGPYQGPAACQVL
ncbi:MAG TPA: GAF domain-containing protein, partial [Chitinophagales bacterium]|nr:GAF domain-containing protein [Chitinophagales bacterium]